MSLTVVKVGSSSLAAIGGGLDAERLGALVSALAARHAAGDSILLVSSGAIAAGLGRLGMLVRPRDLATLQAAAAVGQSALIDAYSAAFGEHGLTVAQVLLTAEDVVRRAHYRNARTTLARLLELRVVPVVNENDTVATEEIRFGDNDRLAALVAHLVDADALLLLSDVDAVYDRPPGRAGAQRVPVVSSEKDLAGLETRGGGSGLGRGGMAGKIEAARLAAASGIPAVIGAATEVGPLLAQVAAGFAVTALGTTFLPTGEREPSRDRWLAHASAPRGRLHLDAGAVLAVLERGASLLPAGVTGADGSFSAGDPVELVGPGGDVVARGLVGCSADELPALLGRSTREDGVRELVHRDDLVLLTRGAGSA